MLERRLRRRSIQASIAALLASEAFLFPPCRKCPPADPAAPVPPATGKLSQSKWCCRMDATASDNCAGALGSCLSSGKCVFMIICSNRCRNAWSCILLTKASSKTMISLPPRPPPFFTTSDRKKNSPKLCENLSPQQIIITLLLSNQLSIFLPVLDSASFLLLLRLPFSCSNQTRWWSHQFCRKQKLHFFLFVTVSPQHHRRRHHQHDHDHD